VEVVVEPPVVAAITPAPQPRSENNRVDADDAQEKEGVDEEITPGGDVMHTPAAAAAATPSNINDSNNVGKSVPGR
jgi:hypothetical protein